MLKLQPASDASWKSTASGVQPAKHYRRNKMTTHETVPTKLRPYRVDYFDARESVGDKVLVRYALVRAVTAREAKIIVLNPHSIAIRAYRFYKKLPKEPGLVSIEKLFSPAKINKVLEEIEACLPTSGPDSPATKAVMKDFNAMMAHDKHEQAMDTFVPQVTPDTTTPQLQAVKETKGPITVRTTDGTLGTLDPTLTNAAVQGQKDMEVMGCLICGGYVKNWCPIHGDGSPAPTMDTLSLEPGSNEPAPVVAAPTDIAQIAVRGGMGIPADAPVPTVCPPAEQQQQVYENPPSRVNWLLPVIVIGTLVLVGILFALHAH
jgi:hypothetical protein